MKSIKTSMLVVISLILICAITSPVYAGGINAVEQGVINYCSGIFHYEGKAYKATSAAISSAYAKLSEDGVDLTPEQGESAKRLISNNVQSGIAQGYLVEYIPETTSEVMTSAAEETSAGETSADITSPGEETTGVIGGETLGTTDVSTSETETTEKVTNSGDSENGTAELNTDSNHTSGTETEQNQVTEKQTTTKKNEGSASGNEHGTTKGEQVTEQLQTSEGNHQEPTDEKQETENKVTGNGEVIDIEEIMQNTDENVIVIDDTKQETIYHIQNYIQGEEIVVKEEGEVVFQNDLPIKNTGYNIKSSKIVLWSLGIILIMNMIAVFVLKQRDMIREENEES